MHALIVTSHPDSGSLTHAIAERLAQGVGQSGATFEMADLAREGFNPSFTEADIATSQRRAPPSADVLAEQARLARADALVLVYPVYWWSMPALLKGWIDRVFTNGWAYDDVPGEKTVKRLGHLPVSLVALGGANLRTYARHGYFAAMRTQIDHGIFGYCGAPVVRSELLLMDESGFAEAHLAAAETIGLSLFKTPVSEAAA